MFSFNCIVCVAGLLGLVRSWDVAVTTTDRKMHYYDGIGNMTEQVNFEGTKLSALAYDAASDLLLLIDELNPNDTIFRILSGNKTQPLVRKQAAAVHSITFDPVTDTIFWSAGGVYRMSLADPRSNGYGELVIAQPGKYSVTGIAVDSCGGYIYWAEYAMTNSTIKRAKLDGSEAKVIVDSGLYTPVGLAVDHSTRSLYWADDSEGVAYKIESSDLDGGDRRTLVKGINRQPKDIAVSEHFIYWSDELQKSIWRIPKNAQWTEPLAFVTYGSDTTPKGLAVKYDLAAQISGNPHCDALKQKLNRSSILPEIIGTALEKRNSACVHGLVGNGGKCECRQGYRGIRCEEHACDSCDVGRCTVAQMDLCDTNRSTRINVTTAQSTRQDGVIRNLTPKQTSTVKSQIAEEVPVKQDASMDTLGSTDGMFVESVSCSSDDWDIKDPIIIALGTLCGLLSIACVVLMTKIIHLRRRPRIKKRIIVNKSVTPLTARPEQQCEITIENCCNMNICETPCFEPRSTIRPTLIGAKAGKEEKKNLIANMEHPDDIY